MTTQELLNYLKTNGLPNGVTPSEHEQLLEKHVLDNRDCLGLGSGSINFDGRVTINYAGGVIGVTDGSQYVGAATGNAPWVAVAQGELGTKEFRSGSNDRIEEYLRTVSIKGGDEIPWCAAFANWCMKNSGYKGTGSGAALSWRNWGVPVAPGTIGAVVVFYRKGGGHVGFCVGVDGDKVKVLGGNQSDAVTINTRRMSDVIAWRWPS